jgi:hypothetical protein
MRTYAYCRSLDEMTIGHGVGFVMSIVGGVYGEHEFPTDSVRAPRDVATLSDSVEPAGALAEGSDSELVWPSTVNVVGLAD